MTFKLSINSLNPRLEHFGKRALLAPRVLKSYLAQRDSEVEIVLNAFHDDQQDDEIVCAILSQEVNLVSFSTYIWNIERVIEICHRLKKEESTMIMLGGPGASYIAEDILVNQQCIDAVALGEGEEVLSLVVERLKQGSHDLSGIRNLAYRVDGVYSQGEEVVLPLEEHDYSLDASVWQECARVCYETSRGCTMKCKFCLWYKGGDNRVRFYPLRKVKSDLARIFDLRRLEMLEFVDADMNLNRKRALKIFRHVRELNDAREKKGLNRVFILYESNPEMLSDEIIEEMTRHDRIIDFGLQTIDEALHRTVIGRMFHRERYFDNLESLVRAPSNRYGEYMLEIIYGLPGDTLQGFRDTIRFILSLPYLMNFWCFRFLMMPGTLFRQESKRFQAKFNPDPPYELTSSATWSPEDLREAQFLSFQFCLIQYGLPDIYEAAVRGTSTNKLKVFEAIFAHFAEKYPEIENLHRECRGPGREVYQFQRCTAFSSEVRYEVLRQRLTVDGLAIVDRFARDA